MTTPDQSIKVIDKLHTRLIGNSIRGATLGIEATLHQRTILTDLENLDEIEKKDREIYDKLTDIAHYLCTGESIEIQNLEDTTRITTPETIAQDLTNLNAQLCANHKTILVQIIDKQKNRLSKWGACLFQLSPKNNSENKIAAQQANYCIDILTTMMLPTTLKLAKFTALHACLQTDDEASFETKKFDTISAKHPLHGYAGLPLTEVAERGSTTAWLIHAKYEKPRSRSAEDPANFLLTSHQDRPRSWSN